MSVTLKDVANVTGYSLSAVSRALNPAPDRGCTVSEATRAKIREAAAKLGFRRNLNASCVRRGLDPAVGAFLPNFENIQLLDLVHGITDAAGAGRYPLNFRFGKMKSFFRFIEEAEVRRSIGCLVCYNPVEDELDEALYRTLATLCERGGKVVFINEPPGMAQFFSGTIADSVRTILYDDYAGGRMAAEHLLGLGCSRLVCFQFTPRCFRERARGFRDAVAAAGMTDALDTIDCGSVSSPVWEEELERRVGELFARRARHEKLGVFIQSDNVMLNLLPELGRRSLVPGRDVRIVGYSGYPIAAYPVLSLTTLTQDFYREGVSAFDMLGALLEGRPVENVLIKPELLVRSSSIGIQ